MWRSWLEADPRRAHADLPQAVKLPRYATCVLVSDFFAPIPETTTLLTGFAAEGVRGHLVQVVDPAEETLPYVGRTEFVEFDGEERLIAGRAETLKEPYAHRLALHRAALKDLAASSAGASPSTAPIARPMASCCRFMD